MKKIIIVLFLITIGYVAINKDNEIIFPDQMIRFRIIANSNTLDDQLIKAEIKQDMEATVISKINYSSFNKTENDINDKMPVIDALVKKYNVDYDINYGDNYFPKKVYKGIEFPEGNYKSLVVTLGDGLGENWWCILFPPLCMLEAENTDLDDIEYKSFIQEIIKKVTH